MTTTRLYENITINASPEKVWDAVVNPEKYPVWTKIFNPTSRFEGGWNTGDNIKFVGVDEKGKEGGMLGTIEEARFPEYICILYHGFISNGVEDTTSPEALSMIGTREIYKIQKNADGTTTFFLELDSDEQYVQMFKEMWPKALLKLKEIAEQS